MIYFKALDKFKQWYIIFLRPFMVFVTFRYIHFFVLKRYNSAVFFPVSNILAEIRSPTNSPT